MKNSIKTLFAVLAISIWSCVISEAATADVTIVDDGKSTFSIVVSAESISSVKQAAEELQENIELSTGAKLSVTEDDEDVSGSFISVGSTKQAEKIGLDSKNLPEESFRILTKDGNLYILGRDIGLTDKNGHSYGTANGVYTFLEDYLDVRWLMPGEIGLDVPHKSTFTLEDIDRTETPKFNMRLLTHLHYYTDKNQKKNVDKWRRVQRLDSVVNWDFNHNWWQTLNVGMGGKRVKHPNTPEIKKLHEQHPDWFAMNGKGKRPLPTSAAAKLETTNQDLVKFYAETAIKAMKKSKRPIAYSLSPTDGRNFSQSPESKALWDPPYNPNSDRASLSSLIIKWYRDISEIVAKEYPEGHLTGYLYHEYLFPPEKLSAKMPDNFSPMIAPSHNYGYGLYREDTQKYFYRALDGWADIITGDWYYYDLPNVLLRQGKGVIGQQKYNSDFPGSVGTVTPAAPDNTNIIFKQLTKSHINGAILYGDPAWGGALNNYILAKKLWNPQLDANEIQKEWLRRAYGEKAGAAMELFYENLNGWFRDYFQKNTDLRYELTSEMLRDLFGEHYPALEKLFLQAKAQPMTEAQKQRLQIIEDNLIVLQWRLQNVDYLPANFVSSLQRSDAQVSDIIAKDRSEIAVFPALANNADNLYSAVDEKPLPWNVRFEESSANEDKSTFPQWKDDQFLIYAAQDGDVRIDTEMVEHSAYFAAYEIRDQDGKLIKKGIFDSGEPITFSASAGKSYLLTIPLREPVQFKLRMQNIALATGVLEGKTLILSAESSRKKAPAYLYYVSGDAPLGSFEEGSDVIIRKPYGGAVAQSYAQKRFKPGYKTYSLDDWIFSPDPQNDGLQRGVTGADFDDSSWKPISPLNWWQLQGFDYHGAAWYRLKVNVPQLQKGEQAWLYFGAVDGDAVIYLNGEEIREHKLGENNEGWDKAFSARATATIKSGENILAVKVTSKPVGSSGMHKGVALIVGKRK